MFEFDTPTFNEYYDGENSKFWNKYCDTDEEFFWFNSEEAKEAAKKKNDISMIDYLNALDNYLTNCHSFSLDSWNYPTEEEIAERERVMKHIIDVSRTHTSGPLADRWLLLEMRANMMLKHYEDNIHLWEKSGSYAPEGYVKEMMRNIYANALLNTGKKVQAWNIYAAQNDNQSLLWSVRKYTNLAGIRQLYQLYPDAPIHKHLLKQYVNTLQEALDYYYDAQHEAMEMTEEDGIETLNADFNEHFESIFGKAYGKIEEDYLKEIKEFAEFSDSVAHEGISSDPGMWEAASALCSYYLGEYAKARAAIDRAVDMSSSIDTKDMARRIRMLIAASSDDIQSPQFKEWMASELNWLDQRIAETGSVHLRNARDRILNLGLARNYEIKNDLNMARLIGVLRDYVKSNGEYMTSTMIEDIFPWKSEDIKYFFDDINSPGTDALVSYAASQINLSEDFKNDLLGTKLLQECKWEEALPYLEKVSKSYLDKQPIAFYAARRDYTIPAWNGHQTVGDSNYEEMEKPQHLDRNVKVDFCKDMIRLSAAADAANLADKDKINLEMAEALFQASRLGQCWYISQYGRSVYEEDPVIDTELAGLAIGLLKQCALSSDPRVKAEALFGLVYASPDKWMTDNLIWDSVKKKYERRIDPIPTSVQYSALDRLNSLLEKNSWAMSPAMSRCDVLKQWRKNK